jgi:serine/threonine protein kinase
MGEVLKKFGRYFLLDQIAQGGMAEIYRARSASVDGSGRLTVIKRIQAGYGQNAEFLQMFKSETKVTMGFSHPNVVQVRNYGEEQKQPYIEMEFVDGKNLRQFLSRFNERKQVFPIDIAAYIIEQSAAGIHYAHSFRDQITGEPLNIIHRDISPQNILISYEGHVKIIDFGIAKATTNSEATRAGVIKGKPSYLSPEQISGEPLDHRCDIFALGTVLWELLTGRKLFAGENDLAVLKLIESASTYVKPPSSVNPNVPKELDAIVMKALNRMREKRYQTAEEMQRALHRFVYAHNPDFSSSDLSQYAKELFKIEIVEDRKLIQRLSDKADQLIASNQDRTEHGSRGHHGPEDQEDTTTIVEVKQGSSVFYEDDSENGLKVEIDKGLAKKTGSRLRPAAPTETKGTTRGKAPARAPMTQNPRAAVAESSGGSARAFFVAVAATLAIGILGPQFGIRIPVISPMFDKFLPSSETRLVLDGNESGVLVTIDGQKISSSLPATVKGIAPDVPHKIWVNAGSNGSFEQEVTVGRGERRVVKVVLEQTDRVIGSAPKSILLRLNLNPGGGGAKIMIDGKPLDLSNASVNIELDKSHELRIERPGYRTYQKDFTLSSAQYSGLKDYVMQVDMDPDRFGYLTIRTTPSADATIMLDGKPWIRKTPIENEKLPVGTYNIRLSNEVLGMEKTITVSIQDGKAISVDERLQIRD